jgi:hypothetical protein
MKYPVAFLILLLAGCGRQADIDCARLDTLLTNRPIDVVILTSLRTTNVLTGPAAGKYAEALSATNRTKGFSSKAQLDVWVRLVRGTNEVAQLSRYDTGDWEFGDFVFRLRKSP